jgi:iron-sulfur cluster repair protein YtfE (RIC family)
MTHPDQSHPAPQKPTQRMDMYVSIHKAMRCFMNDTVERVGRLDVSDASEVDGAMTQVEDLMTALADHTRKEDEFVQPALEARQAGSASKTGGEHREHFESFAVVHEMAQLVRQAPPEKRCACIASLRS